MTAETASTTGGKPPNSILGGVMIVAGTSIGAGMLSLPIISAGMWTSWTMAVLLLSFLMLLGSAYMILHANMEFQPGASFETLVKGTLGKPWNIINGLSVAFVLYILMYAYTSGGGSTIKHALALGLPQGWISLIFALLLSLCIWWGTRVVDRLSIILVAGMVVAFLVVAGGMFAAFDLKTLLLTPAPAVGQSALAQPWFIMAALPYFLTSFSFHASVPSLVKYYGHDPRRVRQCILYGMLVAVVFYGVWILVSFGVLGRNTLGEVYAAGGNVGHFLAALDKVISQPWIGTVASLFAFLAVVTSFLGAGLGLFDYIADTFGFDDSRWGRTKTGLVTFVPPAIGGVFYPEGFIIAIGFAGLAAAIWSVIIPAAMEWKLDRSGADRGSANARLRIGATLTAIVFIYGVVTGIFHLLSPDVANVLPVFK